MCCLTQNTVELLQVCRLMGLPAFERAQDAEYHLIAKAVDMGADGVMIPRTESPEQLKTAVDALLFYPEGRKGSGGHAQFRKGEAYADFKKTRFLMPQIESPKGIEMLPKMLEEYGEYISNSYDKSCGIFCDDEVLAQKYRDMGCNVLWTSSDKDLLCSIPVINIHFIW